VAEWGAQCVVGTKVYTLTMRNQLTLPVDGPFSLAAAASFGFGPSTGRPFPDARLMRLAFVADDLRHHIGAALMQRADGALVAEICGDGDIGAAEVQIRRILSVDTEVTGWLTAGQADPVLGAVQADNPGLRPVLFHSPYEAAAWSVLSQRRHRAQAIAVLRRLSEAVGVSLDVAGQSEPAFPLPERLLEVTEFPGVEEARLARLHGVARAALDGQLDASTLRLLPASEAMARLQRIKGLGPVYSMLVYLRSTGVTDGLAVGEPRLAGYLKHYYGLASTPDAAELERIAKPWRPFRTWAGVLFRAAGEREGLPFEQPARRARGAAGGGGAAA
jgi:DNA-3-methyladenine glycosylase II